MARAIESKSVSPAIEVYDDQWRLIGYVEDRGTLASVKLAREQFGNRAVRILPVIRENESGTHKPTHDH